MSDCVSSHFHYLWALCEIYPETEIKPLPWSVFTSMHLSHVVFSPAQYLHTYDGGYSAIGGILTLLLMVLFMVVHQRVLACMCEPAHIQNLKHWIRIHHQFLLLLNYYSLFSFNVELKSVIWHSEYILTTPFQPIVRMIYISVGVFLYHMQEWA